MDIPLILKNVSPEAAFALGRVVTAHENRAHYRQRVKDAEQRLESARRSANAYGMYEDCGDSYMSDYAEAKGKCESAMDLKLSTERYYKKLKHEFATQFPDDLDVLEQVLPGSTTGLDADS